MKIGYTTGVFDLFHVGHVQLLRRAKSLCDKLIVGVTVDELVLYKGKQSVIPFEERLLVVESCRFTDVAVPQTSINKFDAVKKLKADYLFVGDDWYDSDSWNEMELELNKINCKVIYFPYHIGTSSTLVNEVLNNLRAK